MTSWLKILNLVTFLIGLLVSITLFWIGFGIYFTAGSDLDCFYVFFSLWPMIVLVIIGLLFPRIGGFLLIGNAINYSFLKFISTFYVPGLSVSSVVDDFISYTQKRYLFMNLITISGLMALLGCSFLFIGLKEKSTKLIGEKA
jgi:hypothetical protein